MKTFTVVPFAMAVAVALSTYSHAQESIVGKYEGFFTAQTNVGDRNVGLVIDLQSAEGASVKGTGRVLSGPCLDDYPLEGTFKDGELRLRSTKKGGRAGDCGFGFRGKAESNKLTGRFGKYEVELRK
jgi:hypothetical protein